MATLYFEAAARFFAAGQFCECVFHYQIVDPSTTDDFLLAGQLVAAIDDGAALSWVQKLQNMMSDQCFLSTFRARQFAPTGGNTAVAVFANDDFVGAIASPINTQQIAACINWLPTSAGPKMGRNFIPAVPESMLLSSRWVFGFETAAEEFILKHLTGFSVAAGIFLPIVWNREDEVGTVISDGYLSPKPGTQRRRERAL